MPKTLRQGQGSHEVLLRFEREVRVSIDGGNLLNKLPGGIGQGLALTIRSMRGDRLIHIEISARQIYLDEVAGIADPAANSETI